MADGLDGWVTRLEDAAVSTADSSLRRDGTVPPLTVHVLCEYADPSYFGLLICRPCEPGSDAAVAIASMGVLPGVLAADRVVVCWEHVEVSVALEVPGARALVPGIVVVDARRTGHEVRFHPVRLSPGPNGGPAVPVVLPEWGPVSRRLEGELPEPVARLLRVWRTEQPCSQAEVARVLSSLESAGYGLRWTRQTVPPPPGRP